MERPQEPDANEDEVYEELNRVVSTIGLENAYPWNNTVEFKPNADVLIKMASDGSGRFEIYGILSEKYGSYGLLLNDWIGGEQNWNFALGSLVLFRESFGTAHFRIRREGKIHFCICV